MRLDLNFVDHPKVRRLIHLAGYEGFYGLIRLFSIAGRMYTDGVFNGCEKEVLDGFAEWRKEESLVDILIKVGILIIVHILNLKVKLEKMKKLNGGNNRKCRHYQVFNV